MTTILQTSVEALFPVEGSIHVMLYGEAPGPLGADKSGIPFWGDRSGVNVYRALQESGMALVPQAAFEDWGGERFQRLGASPELNGRCPEQCLPRLSHPGWDALSCSFRRGVEASCQPRQDPTGIIESRGAVPGAPSDHYHGAKGGVDLSAHGRGSGIRVADPAPPIGPRAASGRAWEGQGPEIG